MYERQIGNGRGRYGPRTKNDKGKTAEIETINETKSCRYGLPWYVCMYRIICVCLFVIRLGASLMPPMLRNGKSWLLTH